MSIEVEHLWRKTKPDADGLVPCVVQDIRSRGVLMVAWVSKEALQVSLETGWATFWSRSRATLWEKGKTSGNRQRLIEVRLDCDGDTLLYRVEPEGPACHLGHDSCFFLRRVGEGWRLEPEALLGIESPTEGPVAALEYLVEADEIASRGDPKHPARDLFAGGVPTQAASLRERAEALHLALINGRKETVRAEAVDLVYALTVALRTRKIGLTEVFGRLIEQGSIPPDHGKA